MPTKDDDHFLKDEKLPDLKYVAEIVRHGARAPFTPYAHFTRAGKELLTPMGMRQRYLLGRYNIWRFGKGLGNNLLTPQGIWAEATDVYRTLLSGNSELLGMLYQHQKSTGAPTQLHMTEKQVTSLTGPKTKVIVPFKIRRLSDIQADLKTASTPNGLLSIPIYTTIKIDFNYTGIFSCPYARTVAGSRAKSELSYENIGYSKDILVGAYVKYFGKNYNMTIDDFKKLNMWSLIEFADRAYAEIFENTWDPLTNFTHTEWLTINRAITSWTEQQYSPYLR